MPWSQWSQRDAQPKKVFHLTHIRDDEKFGQAGELCGNHVLRTDQALGAARIWTLCMLLLQAEEGFACLKGSLGLRPNFHQLEARVERKTFIKS